MNPYMRLALEAAAVTAAAVFAIVLAAVICTPDPQDVFSLLR